MNNQSSAFALVTGLEQINLYLRFIAPINLFCFILARLDISRSLYFKATGLLAIDSKYNGPNKCCIRYQYDDDKLPKEES